LEKKKFKINYFTIIICILVIALFGYMATQSMGNRGEAIQYDQVIVKIQNDEISHVWSQGGNFRFRLRDGSKVTSIEDFPNSADYYFETDMSIHVEAVVSLINEKLTDENAENDIYYASEPTVDYMSYIMPVLYIIGIVLLITFFFNNVKMGSLSVPVFKFSAEVISFSRGMLSLIFFKLSRYIGE